MSNWLTYIDKKRTLSILQILQELSRLQNKHDLNFIIIGALPLLIKGYLKYKSYWDIDLLFRDERSLKTFIKIPKSESLTIVHFDDNLMVSKDITSFHTVWAYKRQWVNVDYIIRKRFFEFYTYNMKELKPYTQTIKTKDRTSYIDSYLAHPWDIIVEKTISPRMKKELTLKLDMSIDIRHIYTVYEREKDNVEFWDYTFEKAKYLKAQSEFKKNFLKLLSIASVLGYGDLKTSLRSINLLKK